MSRKPRVRVKICGVRDADEAWAAVDAGADAIGFHFVEGRPTSIDPVEAYEIMADLPPFVSSVGVVENCAIDDFSDIEEDCPTALSQLDGIENPKLVMQCGPGVIKRVRWAEHPAIGESEDADPISTWDELDEVDAILVVPESAWTNAAIDRLAGRVQSCAKPILLGGWTADSFEPKDLRDAIARVQPFAVDLVLGEGDPDGVIERFIEAVR